MYLDKIHFGHTRAQNGAMTSVGPVLFKIWSNYINSLLASNYFSFSFLWADLLAKDTDRFWNIRFVVQTQSNYFFLSLHASWGKNTSLTFPCDANLHHHETELICFTQLRRTALDYFVIIRIHIDAEPRLPRRRDLITSSESLWTFAGLHYQRHFQTCLDHCQNSSCFDILPKAAVQT